MQYYNSACCFVWLGNLVSHRTGKTKREKKNIQAVHVACKINKKGIQNFGWKTRQTGTTSNN